MTSRKRLIVYNWLSTVLPDFGMFKWLRKVFLRWCGVDIHPSVRLSGAVRFVGEGQIVIGENSTIRDGTLFHVSGGGRIELGQNVLIAENVLLECLSDPANSATLTFGDHVDFMMGSLASSNGNAHVRISSNCKIAHNVSIKATEHQLVDEGDCVAGKCVFHDITISEGCWICAGAIITPGVMIGRHNVVGAGAVVIRDSPDNALLAGVPGVVKKLYPFNDKGHRTVSCPGGNKEALK